MIIGVAFAVVVAGIAGTLLLFTRSTPESIQQEIAEELRKMGLPSVTVRVDKEWVATLSGSVTNVAERDRARSFATSHKRIRSVSDAITLPPKPADLQERLNKALAEAGLHGITAAIDDQFVATLMGTAQGAVDANLAEKVAKDIPGISAVRIQVQVSKPPAPDDSQSQPAPHAKTYPESDSKADPAKLEGEINRALRNAGLGGVTWAVSDDFQATIKGSVSSSSQKERSFEIVNGFPEIRKVRDVIFIVN